MNNFMLLAKPWWVNLLIFIPITSYLFFKEGLIISKRRLIITAVFGAAFGFVEASVVIYLRAATGLLGQASNLYQPTLVLNTLSKMLYTIEFFREVATIIMLVAIALLATEKLKERWAIFLWVFGFWDLFYYIGLWLTIKWPSSLTTQDVLFLIPAPWVSQVWFPYFICTTVLLIIALNSQAKKD